jgi:glycosyltransferase involved in cell wall biosynthesis
VNQRIRMTAVTISFNQGEFLERALESVLAQDYPVEHIVIDAGSTDGSRDVIERYRDQLAHVVYERDDGPADGLNKALRFATGDVFVCVNADDALLPRAIAHAASSFARDPEAAVIYASGWFIDASDRRIRRFRSTPFDARRFVLGGVNVMHQSTFVRRDAYLAVGGFNPRNSTSWDAELLVDLASAGYSMRRVPGMWGLFRIHANSISGSARLVDQYDLDRLRLFEKVMGRAPRPGDRWPATLARAEKWLLDPAYLLWRLGDKVGWPITREVTA